MYISKIFLGSFGKFQEGEIDLADGLNCIYGKNEDGKSTIKSFLTYIFSTLHQPYSYTKIAESFTKYKPFNKDDFWGHLLCEELDESGHTVKIYQDFLKMEAPEVIDLNSNAVDTNQDKINVIGFHELQGDNSKDLLLDILNRIEDLKNSNLYGVHANDIFENISLVPKTYKEAINAINLQKELNEINEFLANYPINYETYKQMAKTLYVVKGKMRALEAEAERLEIQASEASNTSLIKLHQTITNINKDIVAYENKVNSLEKFNQVDSFEIEETINEEKRQESLLIALQEKKDALAILDRKARQIGTGRDFDRIIKMTYDEDVDRIRAVIKELNDQHSQMDILKQSLLDYKELKSNTFTDASPENSADVDVSAIARDYYKYISITDWGKSINRELTILENNKPDINAQKLLASQLGKRKAQMYGALGLVIVGSVLYVLLSTLLMLATPVVGFVLFAVAFYHLSITKDALEKLRARTKTYELELNKYQQMDRDNEVKRQTLLERYHIANEAEFFQLYNTTSSVRASFEEFSEKIQEIEGKLKAQEVALRVAVSNVKNLEPIYGVDIKEYIDQPHLLKTKIEEYIKHSKEYVNLYTERELLKEEISVLANKLEGEASEEAALSSKELEANTKDYQLAKFELERLLRMKEGFLGHLTEEQLNNAVSSLVTLEVPTNLISMDHETIKVRIREIKGEIIELSNNLSNIKQTAAKQESYLEKAIDLKKRKEVIEKQLEYATLIEQRSHLTLSALRTASMEISSHITNQVEEKIGEIIYGITKKYDQVRFNEQMEMQFYHHDLDQWKSIKHLSVGTIDQVYIALRLAIVELSEGKNNYPLIFDDSFIQYDKKRLTRVLQYLATIKRQVIILSCHKREKYLMESLDIKHQFIQLS